MVEVSTLRIWTCINAAFVGLNIWIISTLAYFYYGEFGNLSPVAEDLHAPKTSLLWCKGWLPELCLQCSRSIVELSALWSWTYINQLWWACKFKFGLIYGEFGGPLPVVEDLHQNFLRFAAKVATWTVVAMYSRSMVEVSALWSWTYLNAALVGLKVALLGLF